MEFSNRLPKIRANKSRRMSKKNINQIERKYFSRKNSTLVLRGAENLNHYELREMQRYGTCIAERTEILDEIANDRTIIINQDKETVKALIRLSSRYYVVVANVEKKYVKTMLPDTLPNFLDYVQQFIDKENLAALAVAA